MQNRIKSGVAAVGATLTILTAILAGLQTSGVIDTATEAQQNIATSIVTVITIIAGAAFQIYSHYNNPTSKNKF